ncbi:MAG: hypothetical protein EOO29_26220, partial [Comamonadaceae bacterium]
MNDLALASTPSLLADLLMLAECPNAQDYVCISARREHGVRSAHIDKPTLAVVLRGHKRLHGQGDPLALQAGDLFLFTRPTRIDSRPAWPRAFGRWWPRRRPRGHRSV